MQHIDIDCNINIKLNHKVLIVFHNLKQLWLHLIRKGPGKSSLQINIIQNGLRKYLSFGTNIRLIVIDNFHFFPIGSSLDNLVKTLS